MLAALLLVSQVVEVDTLATCRIANDPAARTWTLERKDNLSDPVRDRWIAPVDLLNTDDGDPCVQEPPRARDQQEWIVAVGVARSINLFQSTAGRSYAVHTIGWGRELTGEWGPGVLRGRFTWAVEAMPVFAQFSPSAIYGFGFAPVVWRWNFTPRPRHSIFAELAMGGMWSTEPIPEKTGRGNFTAHWGGGVRLRRRGAHAVVLGYRFQHFSNGNQLGSNPGVNSHVVLIGWSHRS